MNMVAICQGRLEHWGTPQGIRSEPGAMNWRQGLARNALAVYITLKEQKREAVIALCTRTGRAKDIAKEYSITPEALYNWKNDLLGKEDSIEMPREAVKLVPCKPGLKALFICDPEAFLKSVDHVDGSCMAVESCLAPVAVEHGEVQVPAEHLGLPRIKNLGCAGANGDREKPRRT